MWDLSYRLNTSIMKLKKLVVFFKISSNKVTIKFGTSVLIVFILAPLLYLSFSTI